MSLTFTTKEDVATALYNLFYSVSAFKHVDRQYVEPGNYEYPSVFINDVREDRRIVLQDVVDVLWRVTLLLFVYDDSATLSTTLNTEIKRVKDTIKGDPTLGGLVVTSKIVNVDTDEGFLRPHGLALIALELRYLTRS